MLALLAAACTDASSPAPSEDASAPDERDSAPADNEILEPEPSDVEQVATVWEALHTERLTQISADGEPDPNPFAEVATDDAIEAVLELIELGRGDVATEHVATEAWPEVDLSDDEARVADCVLSATRSAEQPEAEPTVRTQAWTGTAVATDEGWRVDELTVGIDDCLPPELNEQLLDAYRNWHEAQAAWSEPPDPEHPLLEQTMVDPGLSDARELLLEDQREGIAWRYPHDPANAVVVDLGVGSARVIDCHEAHPDYGAYDTESGERREDISPAPSPGQMNRVVVDLERSGAGDWLVSGWRTERDSTCTPGETSYAVP